MSERDRMLAQERQLSLLVTENAKKVIRIKKLKGALREASEALHAVVEMDFSEDMARYTNDGSNMPILTEDSKNAIQQYREVYKHCVKAEETVLNVLHEERCLT